MEKIININFQGRIIAIEETAYNSLKQYTDSLRKHFAGEEGNDEIINDIENRIAELLEDKLKRGASCITTADLNAVIDSIGRLEDIEAAEGEETKSNQQAPPQPEPEYNMPYRGRFFRNADDKIIAGVCSGIAIRTGIDPTLVRIVFVLLIAPLFWVYILLWIIVPAQSMRYNITRRFFRNPDGKMIAGVCSGLGTYYGLDTWILRTIFVIPLVVSLLSGNLFDSDWGWASTMFTGSIGGTLVVLYVVLWIVVPYATSATDKMEMRGEKIDINTIKAATQARMSNVSAEARSAGHSIGRAIGIVFKAFFLFIAGVVALSLFAALIALVFAGTATLPYTGFFFQDSEQHIVAWVGVALTLGVPLLALVVWIIRRIMGVRSHRHYLGFVFAGLWVIGIICVGTVTSSLVRDFSTRAVTEEGYDIQQPSTGSMYITASNNEHRHHLRHDRFFGDWDDNHDAPFRYISSDSLWINNIKVAIEQSKDSFFHIYSTRAARGKSQRAAMIRAEHIPFSIVQQDNLITLPDGFTISRKDKFRVQQVLVTVEVPLGKKIKLSNELNDYNWYTVTSNGQRHFHYERQWDWGSDYRDDKDYVMTENGLVTTDTTTSKNQDDE